jgi:hypothetical protein
MWQTSQNSNATGNKHAMSITSTGVGIFNSNPTVALDVAGTIQCSNLIVSMGASDKLSIDVVNGLSRIRNMNTDDNLHLAGANNMYLETFSNATWATRATFLNNGNLGIGTTTPGTLLDVFGSFRAIGDITLSNMTYLYPSTTSNGSTLVLNSAGVANGRDYRIISTLSGNNGGAGSFQIWDQTASVARVHINSNGNIGIGTTTPSRRLEVNGCASVMTSGEARYHLFNGGGVTEWLFGQKSSSSHNFTITRMANLVENDCLSIDNNGNVGVGTASPSYKLHVVGSIYATGDIIAFSDMRLKSNLEKIVSPLDKVSQLTGYTYDFNNDTIQEKTKISSRYTGIVAQDLEKVLPEAVHKDANGNLSVAYGNMAGLFVEAIKELRHENLLLKDKLNLMEERIAKLEVLHAN